MPMPVSATEISMKSPGSSEALLVVALPVPAENHVQARDLPLRQKLARSDVHGAPVRRKLHCIGQEVEHYLL